jgi:hypothetical protein
MQTSAHAISQTELPGYDSLSQTKISSLNPEVAERVGQVAENSRIVPENWGINIDEAIEKLEKSKEILTHPEIPLSDEANALFNEIEPETEKRGFLLQVNQLVREILQLLSQLSSRDRQKTDHLKKEYNTLNRATVDSLGSQGNWNFFGNVANFGVAIACSALGASAAAQPLGSMVQSGLGFYATKFSQRERKSSNEMSLLNTELQNISNSNDISSLKNETLQLLEAAKKCMQDAAHSNG